MFKSLTESEIAGRLAAAGHSSNSDGYTETGAPSDSLRCAAVLVPLLRVDGEWHLLYTRRTDRVESHKGQVSFPGGACDEGETSPEQTALREAEEEIGLRPEDVRVLGRLNSMATISSFRVTPVVGVISWPVVFRPAQAEVARVFTMPLAWLANKSNRWEFNIFGRNHSVIFFHPYDGELLWGATARMTVEFLDAISSHPRD